MQKTATLAVLLFFTCILTCQVERMRGQTPMTFAPIGTKWSYSWSAASGIGAYSLESVADTTIQGKVCRKLRYADRADYCFPNCVSSFSYGARFFYDNQDSLFEFRNARFELIMRTNALVGDTIKIYDAGSSQNQLTYIVKTKSDTLLNGQFFKKWTLQEQNCRQNPNLYSITFIDKIGVLGYPIRPRTACIIDGIYYDLRCFEWGNFKFGVANCLTATNENPKGLAVKISPNPTNATLQIEAAAPFFTYKIVDLMGKTTQNGNYTEGSPLDVSALPQGFYFLTLLNGTRQATVKFVKQ